MTRRRVLFSGAFTLAALAGGEVLTPGEAGAQTPVPPAPPKLPPPGIPIPDTDRAELTAGADALGKEIDGLRAALAGKPLLRCLPDVQIYHNAVRYALAYNEFYKPGEVATAKRFLVQGMERAKALREGNAPWTTQTGLVALGYRSKIDNSIQPYGLLIPPAWTPGDSRPRRLDFFLHGRGDTLSEIAFIDGRQKSAGEFSPADAFVLQPYGRFCNANRFAGEQDALEALQDVKSRYAVDANRVIMRGFSMGGASCWQFATHHADKWAAAAPGAGFTKTATYTKAFDPGKPPLPWYQIKLWRLYDPVDYAANLAQCPVVAYSGEIDPQKAAADNMVAAAKDEGLTLTHLIGPTTGHKYEPGAKKELNTLVDGYAAKGRDPLPRQIRFTTFTLRYNTMHWLTVDGLERHWERARVDGGLTDDKTISLKTENVSALSLEPKWTANRTIIIDGQTVAKTTPSRFVKVNGKWQTNPDALRDYGPLLLRKRHGLQGPIDDAFMDSFIIVRPTGTPLTPTLGKWTNEEMNYATRRWRAIFRGEAVVKDDKMVSQGDIAQSNLVLWGDPSSNAILARIADKLPFRWDKRGVHVGDKTYPLETTVPVFVFPNPLNAGRYVVINSGITFREASNTSNAQQSPKLPDWAIINITTPPSAFAPGAVADAGFFDEKWQLTELRK